MRIIYIFLIIAALLAAGCSKPKYPSGRDTIESFGDGRFQVLHSPRGQKIFYDGENQETILDSTTTWKKSQDKAFLVGQLGGQSQYIILNIESDEINRYESRESIPKKYQDKFKE